MWIISGEEIMYMVTNNLVFIRFSDEQKKNVNNSLLGSDIGTAFWGSTEPLCKLFSRQKYWGFWHFIHNLLELHRVKIRGWIVSYRLTCFTLSGASKETRFCCNLHTARSVITWISSFADTVNEMLGNG